MCAPYLQGLFKRRIVVHFTLLLRISSIIIASAFLFQFENIPGSCSPGGFPYHAPRLDPCPVNPLVDQSGHESLPIHHQPLSLLSPPVPVTSVLFAMVCVQAFARNRSPRSRRALCLHLCEASGRLSKFLVSISDY